MTSLSSPLSTGYWIKLEMPNRKMGVNSRYFVMQSVQAREQRDLSCPGHGLTKVGLCILTSEEQHVKGIISSLDTSDVADRVLFREWLLSAAMNFAAGADVYVPLLGPTSVT
ncbi:hypothetical protein RRF57_002559 [Xylaria bambusicola]|uniref:Uncharacterized protein n=1 Tax=Xylaria bambusicola TaxID=326684 RepID=A0AAN7UDB1_9PEZI